MHDVSEGNLIFWEEIESVTVRKRSSYDRVSNCEWLPKSSCLNTQIEKHCV